MKLSLITATFNNDDTLEDTLKSVMEQKSPSLELEYIIVDGGSSDNTLEIIDEHKKHIDILIQEPDNGIYDALNKGLRSASGDIIGFLHADDIFANSNVLKNISRRFHETNCNALYGDLQYVHRVDTERTFRKWKAGRFKPSKLNKGWMPPHPAFYATRQIYATTGYFNTKYSIAADYDLLLRILKKPGLKIEYIPEYLVKMRIGGESNRNLRNIIRKSIEDYQCIKQNNVGGVITVILKNLRKIHQLI